MTMSYGFQSPKKCTMESSNGRGSSHTKSSIISQQHCFVGRDKQIQPTPHPCKCKRVQALPTLCNFLRIGNKVIKGERS